MARRTISDKKSMVLMAVTFGGKWFCEVVTQSIDSEAYKNCLKNMHQKFSHQANPRHGKNQFLFMPMHAHTSQKKIMNFFNKNALI